MQSGSGGKRNVKLPDGWEGICQAGRAFDQKLAGFTQECQSHPLENKDLLVLLETLRGLLADCIRLYEARCHGKYTNDYTFAFWNLKTITDLAINLINLKPDNPKNEKDLKFADLYIEFLETLKEIDNPPEIPAILKPPIVYCYLSDVQNIEDKKVLFNTICDKGILTQEYRKRQYQKA